MTVWNNRQHRKSCSAILSTTFRRQDKKNNKNTAWRGLCQESGHTFSAWVASNSAKTPAFADESTKRINGPSRGDYHWQHLTAHDSTLSTVLSLPLHLASASLGCHPVLLCLHQRWSYSSIEPGQTTLTIQVPHRLRPQCHSPWTRCAMAYWCAAKALLA